MPVVTQRQAVTWTWQLERNGKIVFQDQRGLAVFPPLSRAVVSARLGLYDPVGTTQAVIEKLQLTARPVESLDRLPADLEVLIIGDGLSAAEVVGYSR